MILSKRAIAKRLPRPVLSVASRCLWALDQRFISLSPAALPVIQRAIREAPPGDYYEFGCFRGWLLLQAQKALPAERAAWGFDSFQGLPQTDAPDFVEGQFAADLTTVRRKLARGGFDFERGGLIKGFFEESLTPALRAERPFAPAAVVMIDCDLGSGTTAALRWLEDGLLQPGSVILLDDWHTGGGQREAFEAWFAGARWRRRRFAEWPKHGVGWQLGPPQTA